MYTLYYSPLTCSLAVHIALEKIGEDFRLEKVDVRQGMHEKEEYLALNRHGKVPLLMDGERAIDQSAGIILYLADKHSETNIMPAPGEPSRAEALSALFYMSNTLHPTLAMAFYPERYSHGKSQDVLSKALERTQVLLSALEQGLHDRDYLSGAKPYGADYYLVTILNWLQVFQIKLDNYPNLMAYKKRMNDLPEVSRAMRKEMGEY